MRVSLVCFTRAGYESVAGFRLDGEPVDGIYTDLTAPRSSKRSGPDLTRSSSLPFLPDSQPPLLS